MKNSNNKKSNSKKNSTVKKTTKRVNKVNKKDEKVVKIDKKKEVKEEIKEESVSKANNKKGAKENRYLIIGLLYLFCGLIWVIDGTSKLLVSESYMWDIIFGVILFLLSYFYFRRYKIGKK